MRKCSYCGKENDDASAACAGCGTPLIGGPTNAEASQNPAPQNPRVAYGNQLMIRGALWFIGGTGVTLLSYSAASSGPYGGHYVIAFGAIIFGLAQLFRGLSAASGTDNSQQAEELLQVAAQLETADRARSIALYADIVKNFPGTRAGKEAQKNMETLLSYERTLASKNGGPPER